MPHPANTQPIYHLTPLSYYRCQPAGQPYRPATFEQEGFVHCTGGQKMLLQVANHYFAHLAEPLLALEIDPIRLTAPLKFEPPSPPPGATATAGYHAQESLLFPHIYGPINQDAIINHLVLRRDAAGRWQFPEDV